MNENLKGLAIQAGAKFFKDKGIEPGEKIVVADQGSSGLATNFVPAYAELILSECLNLLENGWQEGIGEKYQGDVFAEALRKQFGLKG